MGKNKKKKSRENNIDNTIKSILYSNREISPKNIRFSILKEILKSNKRGEIFNKFTNEFRNVVIYYKVDIDNDLELENAIYYIRILDEIRAERINKIVSSGNMNKVCVDKLQNSIKNKEIEEDWVDRGYTCIKLYNGVIEVKIEDKTQLDYQLNMLKLETINNIFTDEIIIDKHQIDMWLNNIKSYALKTYGTNPKINRNIIHIGENNIQLERCFLYYCLTDGKIHIVYRKKIK